jgi:hypothetical protein
MLSVVPVSRDNDPNLSRARVIVLIAVAPWRIPNLQKQAIVEPGFRVLRHLWREPSSWSR